MKLTRNFLTIFLAVSTAGMVLASRHRHLHTSKDASGCKRNNFFNETTGKCQSCSLCGPGTFLKGFCRGNRDTRCKECPTGHFSSISDRYPGDCARCKECGIRPVLQQCTKKSDTVCGSCPIGTYWSFYRGRCTECSYCFPDVLGGFSIEKECQIPQIPATHQCSEAFWKPHNAPHLIPQTDDYGNKYFISSEDVIEDRTTSATHRATAKKAQTATRWDILNTLSTTENPFKKEKVDDNFYLAAGCATMLCMAILACAALFWYKRRTSKSVTNNDCRSIAKRDQLQKYAQFSTSNEVFA